MRLIHIYVSHIDAAKGRTKNNIGNRFKIDGIAFDRLEAALASCKYYNKRQKVSGVHFVCYNVAIK